jgi:hypothetical protein
MELASQDRAIRQRQREVAIVFFAIHNQLNQRKEAVQVKQVELAHAGWAQHPLDLGRAQVNPRHKPDSPANGRERI